MCVTDMHSQVWHDEVLPACAAHACTARCGMMRCCLHVLHTPAQVRVGTTPPEGIQAQINAATHAQRSTGGCGPRSAYKHGRVQAQRRTQAQM